MNHRHFQGSLAHGISSVAQNHVCLVQIWGSDQRNYTALSCQDIWNNWTLMTSVWTTVFTNASADISLMWYHWQKKQISLFQDMVQKRNWWNAEIWVQPSMSVVGVEKFTSAKEPAVTKTSYNVFSWFSLLMLKTMILWRWCSHFFFQLVYCDIQKKARMCRSKY